MSTLHLSGEHFSGELHWGVPRRAVAVVPARGVAVGVSAALAVVAASAAAITAFMPDLIHAPAVMVGSARGTALVMLFVGVPALGAAVVAARMGSVRAVMVWLGAAAYLLYNSVLMLFMIPFNELFLLYVALLGLALWAIGTLVAELDVRAYARQFGPALPYRALCAYTWAAVALNALAWLAAIVPALGERAPAFLAGSGLTTNPIYVQDLAVWLPLIAIGAWWLWQGLARGYLVVSAALVMWVIEALSVGADQLMGSAADPTSTLASATMGWVFLVVAAIGLIPALVAARALPPAPSRFDDTW